MSETAIREDGDRLFVSGSLTIPQAARLLRAGVQFAGSRDALFDLAGVEQIDSSGIAVILGWLRAATAAGRTLKVANAPESLRSIAKLYGVEEILPLI
jgi:phospholipid transport system transporter-binding protein